MKKATSIFILFIFLFATVGVIANSYQCRVVMQVNKSCCDSSDNGCCEKNSKLLKIDDDFVGSPVQLPVKPISSSFFIFDVSRQLLNPSPIKITFLRDHAPPDPSYDQISFLQSFLI